MVFVQFFIYLKISFLSRSRTRSRLGKPRFQNDRDPESIDIVSYFCSIDAPWRPLLI
jgi:hypothetical protein